MRSEPGGGPRTIASRPRAGHPRFQCRALLRFLVRGTGQAPRGAGHSTTTQVGCFDAAAQRLGASETGVAFCAVCGIEMVAALHFGGNRPGERFQASNGERPPPAGQAAKALLQRRCPSQFTPHTVRCWHHGTWARRSVPASCDADQVTTYRPRLVERAWVQAERCDHVHRMDLHQPFMHDVLHWTAANKWWHVSTSTLGKGQQLPNAPKSE